MIIYQARSLGFDHVPYGAALHLSGYYPLTPISRTIFRPLLLTALLFLGPLFEKFIQQPNWHHVLSPSIAAIWTNPIYFRNYIAGPASEEILFRSVLIPLHILAGLSPVQIVLITPLFFGIAHVHHLYEFMLTHPDLSWTPALLNSLFQFIYTTIFGWYASFVYLRTASTPTLILIHSFCNWCGLPRLWGQIRLDEEGHDQVKDSQVPLSRSALPTSQATDFSDKKASLRDREQRFLQVATLWRPRRLPLVFTVIYYILLHLGAYAFWQLLWTLTESPTALMIVA